MRMDDTEDHFIKPKIHSGTLLTGNNCLISANFNHSLSNKNKFVNFSIDNIAVCFRDGTIGIVPPIKNETYQNKFVISFHKSNNIGNIIMIDGDEDARTNALRLELAKNQGKDFYYEEVIDAHVIKNARKGIYVPSADVLLIISDRLTYRDHHPFCQQFVRNNYLNLGDEFNPDNDIDINIRIINNEGTMPNAYLIMADMIMLIKPKKSNTLKNGVYIAGLTSVETTNSNSIRRDEWYSVDDVFDGKAPIKLYPTLSDARDALILEKEYEALDKLMSREHESRVANLKHDREQMELEIAMLKSKQAMEKQKWDERELELNREINKEKLEAEARMNKMKEDAIKSSNRHKSGQEVLKTFCIVLTTVITVVKLFK